MEICFVFNIQTKRTIAALLIYFHVGFSWCLVIEYLFVYIIAQSRTIPAQSPFFTAQFASQNPHIFLFFPAPCQKACIVYKIGVSLPVTAAERGLDPVPLSRWKRILDK